MLIALGGRWDDQSVGVEGGVGRGLGVRACGHAGEDERKLRVGVRMVVRREAGAGRQWLV